MSSHVESFSMTVPVRCHGALLILCVLILRERVFACPHAGSTKPLYLTAVQAQQRPCISLPRASTTAAAQTACMPFLVLAHRACTHLSYRCKGLLY